MNRHLAICFLILITLSAAASASIKLTPVGGWGGLCSAVAVDESYIYTAIGKRFIVFDKSNPASLTQIGTVFLSYTADDIVLAGNYAYVAVSFNDVEIVDISDPAAPEVIGKIDGISGALQVSGNYLYVAGSITDGLKIYSIADPAHPVLVGRYAMTTNCSSLAVNGRYLYLDQFYSTHIIDISNPASPQKIGSFGNTWQLGLTVSGSYLFCFAGDYLKIYSLSNPVSPSLLSSTATNGYNHDISISGNRAYIACSEGLQIFDISNPSTPISKAYISGKDYSGRVVTEANIAYLAGRYEGLLTINVSDSLNPKRVGTYSSGQVWGADLSGSRLYLSCRDSSAHDKCGMYCVDVSDPKNGVLLGRCDAYDTGSVIASGDYAWTIEGWMPTFNFTNPAVPAYVGIATFYVRGTDHTLIGNTLYDNFGAIIDISNPSNPIKLNAGTQGYGGNAIDVSNGYEYAASDSAGLLIVDVTNPAEPALMGTYSCHAEDIRVVNGLGYLCTGTDLYCLDLSNPVQPNPLGRWHTEARNVEVSEDDEIAYLTSGPGAIEVLDVSQPLNPVIRGSYLGGYAKTIVSGQYLYSLCADAVDIFRVDQSDECFVYGYVRDNAGGSVFKANVTMEPGGYTATTDIAGYYVFRYVPAGSYSISASAELWKSGGSQVSVSTGDTAQAPDIVFQLGRITGSVKDKQGNPLKGAKVSVDSTHYVLTVDDGIYNLTDIKPGTCNVTVSLIDYAPQTNSVNVTGGEASVSNFTLDRTGSLVIYAKDNLNRPLQGINVSYESASGVTDADGKSVFAQVLPGTHWLAATGELWYWFNWGSVTVSPGQTVTATIIMPPGKYSGRISDINNKPIPGVTVTMTPGNAAAVTDAAGNYIINNLYPGYYDITVSKPGWKTTTATSKLIYGNFTTTEGYVLLADAAVQGVVRDSSGRPIADVDMVLQKYDGTFKTTNTDASGYYVFGDITTNTHPYYVTASKDAYATVTKQVTVSTPAPVYCNFTLSDAVAINTIGSCALTLPCGLQSVHVSSNKMVSHNKVVVLSPYKGYAVIDVSNPSSPVCTTSQDDTSVRGAALNGNRLYLICSTQPNIRIIDISNSRKPVQIGSFNDPGCSGVAAISGEKLFYVSDGKMKILDTAIPKRPGVIGSYNPGQTIKVIAISGSYVYVALDYEGLDVVDISNIRAPRLKGSCRTAPFYPTGIYLLGGYAYIADNNSGYVVNISNPAHPVFAGNLFERITSLCGSGNQLYCAQPDKLSVLDVSNPSCISLIGSAGDGFFGVARWGNYIYAQGMDNKFYVMQVAN